MRPRWFSLGLALIACGKLERRPADSTHEGTAGNAPTAGIGGSTGASGGSGGSGGTITGGSDSGGAPINGNAGKGGGSSSGGAGAGAGAGGTAVAGAGAGGTAGDAEAGAAGAAGEAAVECAGEYDACGCGCCGGTTPTVVCYYPERGDSLEAIKSADQEAAMSPTCANAGCSLGTHYECCTTPSVPPPPATYRTSGGFISTDLWRVSLFRTGEDARCQFFHIARGDGPGGLAFPIELPDGWIVESATDYLCADENSAAADSRRPAVGGVGQLAFGRGGGGGDCQVAFDFTLFFPAVGGGVDAVHFSSEGQGLPAPDVPECE